VRVRIIHGGRVEYHRPYANRRDEQTEFERGPFDRKTAMLRSQAMTPIGSKRNREVVGRNRTMQNDMSVVSDPRWQESGNPIDSLHENLATARI